MTGQPLSGRSTFLMFLKETTWGTPVTVTKTLGLVKSFSTSERNNVIKIAGIGARSYRQEVPGKYEASGSAEFELQAESGNWFGYAGIGVAPVDAGSGPYTHTYSESDTAPVFPFTFEIGMDASVDGGTTDHVRTFTGMKVNQVRLAFSEGEIATISFDWLAKTVAESATIHTASYSTGDALSFAHGTFTVGGSAMADIVQSGEVTMTNNVEMIYGMGARTPQAVIEKGRWWDFKFTLKFGSLDNYGFFLAGAANSTAPAAANITPFTVILTFDNTKLTTNSRKVVLTLSNCYFDEESLSMADPTAMIMQDVTGYARTGSLVVTDNSATYP